MIIMVKPDWQSNEHRIIAEEVEIIEDQLYCSRYLIHITSTEREGNLEIVKDQ